ncbi:sialate O-acetylesterase [Roseimarinus sediminis]|uniref:sialate O-acetylesterase n=1 Tax=Roseimarinus sediminis TaxID=1610899 RepID=UPI003D2425F0
MGTIKKYRTLLAFAALLLSFTMAKAEIRLPQLISSNMVMQRNSETRVWGWADPREKITVSFGEQTLKTRTAKDGRWEVKLSTGDAGGPYTMTISGKNKIQLDNIMLGDVWVCSGQSNMEWPLINTIKGPEEVAAASHPNIRLFQVENNASPLPADDTAPAQWAVCSPETVAAFSAVGYHFGKKIHLETGVPIGLISSNWGGTIIETWISGETAAGDDFMASWLEKLKGLDIEAMAREQKAIYETYKAKLNEVNSPSFSHPFLSADFNDRDWKSYEQPMVWEHWPEFQTFDGIMWYRKSFELPVGFNLNKATLSLARIDDTDITWLNGRRVGDTYNQYNELRSYKIPGGVLKVGSNQLLVRVEDYSGGGGFHGKADEMYLSDGVLTVPLSGEWKLHADETPTPRSLNAPGSMVLMPNQFPTLLYNGMIHPLLKHAIKGAIWYQGESNADALYQAKRYEEQMRLLIADWRKQWNNDKLSFYMVQLANFRAESEVPQNDIWPVVREAQTRVATDPMVEMACIIDIGEAGDIHPRNKYDVGQRLALDALKLDYGFDLVNNGPRFSKVKMKGKSAVITFDTQGSDLQVRNKYGYINGFAVAGNDQKFVFAKARLINDTQVEVYSDSDIDIVAVRFLWADNPGKVNLYNAHGLPAEPFRTDQW